jgi:hypothetical protein
MLSQYQIAEAIEAEVERMQGLVDEIRQAAVDTARAEADFKVRFAQHRLQARTSPNRLNVDTVDDMATVATEDERYAHLIAVNNLSTLREALRASQSHIDALRTLAASHRIVAP